MEGFPVLSDHLYHLFKVPSFTVGPRSQTILFRRAITISRVLHIMSFRVTFPGDAVVGQVFNGLFGWRISRTGGESIRGSTEGLDPSRAGGSGYQLGLFLQEVRITYRGSPVPTSP